MTDYTELVKALRHCVSDEKGVTKCAGCPYYPDITGCMDRLHTDAAAAIEELQATIELMKPFMPDFFPDANKVTLPKMEVQDADK